MEKSDIFSIQGLAGKKTLAGTVHIQGAKNAVLKAMAGAVLFDGQIELKNVPNTEDVRTLIEIMKKLGAKITDSIAQDQTLKIDADNIKITDIDPELAASMRASVVLTGPILARYGKVTFPAPGGCVLGARPIDLFLEGYKKMGCVVREPDGLYDIQAENGILGTEIFFNKQTVGGTETLMMAAVLANGTTVLRNCAMEPEIQSVAQWLNDSGANITGLGTTTLTIHGTGGKLLHANAPYITIPDRIEAGSFLILGALCASELMIQDCEPIHMCAVIDALKTSGVNIEIGKNYVKIFDNTEPNSKFHAISDLRTHEYPGFPTDLQAPMTTYLTQVAGESSVFETIYEGRFKYVEDLQKMGAKITIMNPREILIKGPTDLETLPAGETLRAYDIRAGFAIVLAALLGRGNYEIINVNLIDRGYERFDEKLREIGVKVSRE